MLKPLKIFIYCQHVWGVGHFFRIREIARALEGHDVVLVTGGPEIEMPLPDHVRRCQLPAVRMQADKKLTAGSNRPTEDVWPERINLLENLFRTEAPDIFIVELYPLGRKAFRRELDPILAGIRLGRLPGCRVYCSVRDILVKKPDPAEYEARVCRDLNRWFDALLVHADPSLVVLNETFGGVANIEIPVVYTGYVARPGPGRTARQAMRQKLGIDRNEKLIVVSAGGGKSGYPLMAAMLAAQDRLARKERIHMAVFTGPYLPDTRMKELQSHAGPGVAIQRFSPDFPDWLAAADLSVSMAGYNTCMNLLTAGVPAILWPFTGDREQPLRSERLARKGWVTVLQSADMEPQQLSARITEALNREESPNRQIDLQGAQNTAHYIQQQHRPRKRLTPKKPIMKIIVYCQHLLGVGHFFRTLEICRALAGHDVILVTGGQLPDAPLPANVRHRKLPELVTDPYFQSLHSPRGEALKSIHEERYRRLRALLREEAPDVFLIELYPIGRKAFRFELDPLLDEIATGQLPRCKVVCSVRDILVEKEDQARHETRAVDSLNRWFDALLVHADPDVIRLDATFSRMDAIRIPIFYTGFVAPPVATVGGRVAWRKARGITPDQILIVVSAGGGVVGFPLLDAVTRALPHLPDERSIRMQVFTGPFMPAENIAQLNRRSNDRLRIDRFASDFPSWLNAADLSVSMAGYNTCMNILASGVPALVLPFTQNREQGLRARLLEDRGLLGVLSTEDLNLPGLADRIAQRLQSPRQVERGIIDIKGAVNTARWITKTMPQKTSTP